MLEGKIMAIKLSTGKEPFELEFENGAKETIYFNPNDPDLISRLLKAKENIGKKLDTIDPEEIAPGSEGNIVLPEKISDFEELSDEQIEMLEKRAEKSAKMIEQTKKIICEEIDLAFASDISPTVFKYCSPLGIVNGEYYITQFLEAITPEIKKRITKANAEAEKKMEKHIAKYRKGKKK